MENLIVVFAEEGGIKLLGKAREIADSSGYRVLAVCSRSRKQESKNFAHLGADEVLICNASSTGQWTQIFSRLLRESKEIKFLLFPSNTTGNLILGYLSTSESDKVGVMLDGAESITEFGITKSIRPSWARLIAKPSTDKVTAVSVRIDSISLPYKDPSRYGNVREENMISSGMEEHTPKLSGENELYAGSENEPIFLAGKGLSESETLKLRELSRKYKARLAQVSGSLQVIYGPCFAVNVHSRLSELPEFQGDLLALNSSEGAPIQRVADMSLVCHDIFSVLEELLSIHS